MPILVLLSISSCGTKVPDDIAIVLEDLPDKVDFNIHVKPILSDKCYACHGPDATNQKAGLRLDSAEEAYGSLESDPSKVAIKPKSLLGSDAYHRIISTDPELIMPPPEFPVTLDNRERAILIKWIQQGAEYKDHWAYMKPQKVTPPAVDHKDMVINPIDNFIIKGVEDAGLTPSVQADKDILLRRVSLDLTGLPPSLNMMNKFLADDRPEAYEVVVDELLDSKHYGEHMAATWMDVARFSDTHGYTVDRYRDMSPWRDWVIKAYNENMPYDEFVTWQIAGDLLPDPTKEQILATGFNRNHQQNMEGGIVEEEFKVEYVADRTNTFGAAFLGLTYECSRCHDHKYDPITQKDYFSLYSYFNNVNEAGQISWDDAMPVPTMLLTDDETDEILAFVNNEIKTKEAQLQKIVTDKDAEYKNWLTSDRKELKTTSDQLVAHYTLDEVNIRNKLNPRQKGIMNQKFSSNKILPNIVAGKVGNGLKLNGDAWLECTGVGVYERSDQFSIGLWVNIPTGLENGVIYHKGIGAALYNFRGYHLALKDNRLQLIMARSLPDNAIVEYLNDIPRDKWIHLTMTYDGSSRAGGLNLYLDGERQATMVEVDNLYKSILFHPEDGIEPPLQIGARWRGMGVKGVIVDDIKVYDKALTALEVISQVDTDAYQEIVTRDISALSDDEQRLLQEYYLVNVSQDYYSIKTELDKNRNQLFTITDTLQEVMVMKEMKTPKTTHLLERGAYDAPGEIVTPGMPSSILEMPEDYPNNRLGLAMWLTHEDNPLTAKVYINRVWQSIFGTGLVRTANDFGNQGELPSHPELLDWLASEFVESGWDVKHMIKLMVTSGAYRQTSISTPEATEQDPQNILLARGPSNRLTAEMLRDNVLQASGLLVNKVGGPSVKPYQPDGLWMINGGKYIPGEGEDLYRRSLYTFWKRTIPNPSLATFDAPDRANCTVQRQKTSTPLQALVLLNDPTYVEASKVLGYNISTAENPTSEIIKTFQKLTGRLPSDKEIAVLQKLAASEKQKFENHPEKRFGWLNTGQFAISANTDKSDIAANTVVASTIINADATVIKR